VNSDRIYLLLATGISIVSLIVGIIISRHIYIEKKYIFRRVPKIAIIAYVIIAVILANLIPIPAIIKYLLMPVAFFFFGLGGLK
jgi:multisubunit Na+/H+ antiporter MnhE subunit